MRNLSRMNHITQKPSNGTARPCRTVYALIALLTLSACSIAPIKPPERTIPSQYASAHANTSTINIDTWWTQFNDPQLTQYVQSVAAANFDIQIAMARAQQASYAASISLANLRPTVNMIASASRDETGLPPQVKQGKPDTDALRLGGEFKWEIDLFGVGRSARRAAKYDAMAANIGIQGAQLTAISEACKQYLTYQSLLAKKQTIETLRDISVQLFALTEERYQAGLDSELTLTQAALTREQTKAQLPPLQAAIDTIHHQLALLAGKTPAELTLTPNPAVLAAAIAQQDIPTGQPIDLFNRRPDIQAAHYQLLAQNARVAEANAQRLPRLFLNLAFGTQDLTLNTIDIPRSFYRSLAAAFAMPILDFGRIKNAQRIQQANQQQSLVEFDKTVLTAFNQVESAIDARAQYIVQFTTVERMVSLSQKAFEHATLLNESGQIDRLRLMDAQQSMLNARLTKIETQLQTTQQTVNIFTALGGSWLPSPPPSTIPMSSP